MCMTVYTDLLGDGVCMTVYTDLLGRWCVHDCLHRSVGKMVCA